MTSVRRLARRVLYGTGACLWAAFGFLQWLRGPRPQLPLDPAAVERILVIRLDLLGDVVLSIPAIRALSATFPCAEIDVLCLPFTAPVLAGVGEIHKVHTLDANAYRRPGGLRRLPSLLATARTLRARRYDVAVGLAGLTGGVFAAASGAHIRVGYADETFRGAYNVPVPGRRYGRGQHEVDYCLDLVSAIALGQGVDRIPTLDPQVIQSRTRTEPWAPPLPRTTGYAVLVPGATNGAAKRWPTQRWAELGSHLTAELGLEVVLVGSAAESVLARTIAVQAGRPFVDLTGQTSIEQLIGVLSEAMVVVAGDTGPLHLAAALGRPTVGIFGPTDPRNSGPGGPLARVVRMNLACSPCYDMRSPADCKLPDHDMPCMWGVTPGAVLDAVRVVTSALPPRDQA